MPFSPEQLEQVYVFLAVVNASAAALHYENLIAPSATRTKSARIAATMVHIKLVVFKLPLIKRGADMAMLRPHKKRTL